jgi:hypothetical protein
MTKSLAGLVAAPPDAREMPSRRTPFAMALWVLLGLACSVACGKPQEEAKATEKPAKAGKVAKGDDSKAEAAPSAQSRKVKVAETTLIPPQNWRVQADKLHGYSFYIPKGSTVEEKSETELGLTMVTLPAPHSTIVVTAMAVEAADVDMAALEKFAKEFVEDVIEGSKYSIEGSKKLEGGEQILKVRYLDQAGKLKFGRVLLAVDKEGGYCMFVSDDGSAYRTHKATIMTILGSFEMFPHVRPAVPAPKPAAKPKPSAAAKPTATPTAAAAAPKLGPLGLPLSCAGLREEEFCELPGSLEGLCHAQKCVRPTCPNGKTWSAVNDCDGNSDG